MTDEHFEDNCYLFWMHLIKYSPRLAPSFLALKKQFKNLRLKRLADDQKIWITELKFINNQMDEIGLILQMSDDNFMLPVMSNLSNEYGAVLTHLKKRLMSEHGEKLTIELMHQKLNAHFKRLHSKKEEKNKIEEKALAFGMNNNLKVHAGTVANMVTKLGIFQKRRVRRKYMRLIPLQNAA